MDWFKFSSAVERKLFVLDLLLLDLPDLPAAKLLLDLLFPFLDLVLAFPPPLVLEPPDAAFPFKFKPLDLLLDLPLPFFPAPLVDFAP